MGDYISREAAIKAIEEPIELLNSALDDFVIVGADRKKLEFTRDALAELKKDITEIPAADVVEVVRCKDCSKREICRTTNIWAVAPNDNWYCADAERRKDG